MDKNSRELAFALAKELEILIEGSPDQFDGNTWDNLVFWRSGILSQGVVSAENLDELIEYLGVERVYELVARAAR